MSIFDVPDEDLFLMTPGNLDYIENADDVLKRIELILKFVNKNVYNSIERLNLIITVINNLKETKNEE